MKNVKDFEINFTIEGEPNEDIQDIIKWFNKQMAEYMGDVKSLSIKEVKK
ncbi:hypothetical protein [Methanobrevibacter arboriphilus]|nr:hypothetical protein [Methanobrevibacter arboriphilus]